MHQCDGKIATTRFNIAQKETKYKEYFVNVCHFVLVYLQPFGNLATPKTAHGIEYHLEVGMLTSRTLRIEMPYAPIGRAGVV